ncbi:MAG: hypothetical protein M1832_001143 [Thelocarpon impressellum]|nr:MAG: hypothetical protein M1832_001143 [Thelocarpon impressellum]
MALLSLPPEVLQETLTRLPISSLLSFGRASRHAHALADCSLGTLALGVFHSRLSGLVSFMDSSETGQASAFAVTLLLEKREARNKQQLIRNQNTRAAAVLHRHAHSLRDLELVLWELQPVVIEALARMPNLRRLSLRFDHPHTRHSRISRSYWDEAPAGTVWNLLAESPKGRDMFGRLESISLQRAGITDYQLKQIIRRNPRVTELRLQKCLVLTHGFFDWLANRSPIADTLRVLHFTKSGSAEVDARIYAHIPKLTALESLSLHACTNLDSDVVRRLNKDVWHIPHLAPPHSPESPPSGNGGLEVDPMYR